MAWAMPNIYPYWRTTSLIYLQQFIPISFSIRLEWIFWKRTSSANSTSRLRAVKCATKWFLPFVMTHKFLFKSVWVVAIHHSFMTLSMRMSLLIGPPSRNIIYKPSAYGKSPIKPRFDCFCAYFCKNSLLYLSYVFLPRRDVTKSFYPPYWQQV